MKIYKEFEKKNLNIQKLKKKARGNKALIKP